MNTPKATIDFETRSACDLRACGAWKYSIDPTTEILCLGYHLPHWSNKKVALWHPPFLHLGIVESQDGNTLLELIEWIKIGGLVEAHNAWFERSIWTNILVPRHGFPVIQPFQWRCSAAKAAAHALPRHLADAGEALNLPIQKSESGHKLMMKVSKPRKARKKEREAGVRGLLWWESKEFFQELWDYCKQDVLAEHTLSTALPDLNPYESQIYILDQCINERGFQLDMQAVRVALQRIRSETHRLNQKLAKLTQGAVKRATQRAKLLRWLNEVENVGIWDTKAETIAAFTSDKCRTPLSDRARHALRIIRLLGKSSTAKYIAMRNQAAPDGKVRGGLIYHGASTGRWTGAGVQPHNFPRGAVKDIETLWADLKAYRTLYVSAKAREENKPLEVMEGLSQGLRGAIVPSPGYQLFVADYAAIEARVVMWLAGEVEALDMFRKGVDIYLDMASAIYDKPCNKEEHPQERQLGKATILGCGFQMGASRFVDTAALYGVTIDEEFAETVVALYRSKYARVKQTWYDYEDAALRAVQTKRPVVSGKVRWLVEGRFLYAELPSKRRLAYPDPEIHERQMPWGSTKNCLTFMGIDSYTHKWRRQVTYGGSLVENVTQAVARDIMAEAIVRYEESGIYRVVLSVHDEILAEALEGQGSIQEFESLLTTPPMWAKGCPIAAEGWVGKRYRK